jgi:hypothetical protein
MYAIALALALCAADTGNWQVVREPAREFDVITWWTVAYVKDGRTVSEYASYSPQAMAHKASAEMNRRRLGPKWWIGRQIQEVIDIRDAISEAANDIPSPSIEEQRKWWKSRQ